MWIFLGTKDTAERVPNGRRVERHCPQCGETAMFYERRVTSSVELYWIKIVDYRTRHVMACGACGALFAADDGVPTEPTTTPERIAVAAEKAGSAVAAGAKSAFARVQEAVKSQFGEHDGNSAHRDEARREEPRATSDPLADDEAALEAKFKDLEKKYRV